MLSPVTPELMSGLPCTAGFTTRAGGISQSPFDSLNLGGGTPDDPGSVRENMARLYHHIGVDAGSVADMGQVHGTTVRCVRSGGTVAETDGIATDVPGLALLVRIADCVPLLLCDPTHRAVAAVHCGWRSLTGGIVERMLTLMAECFYTSADNLFAAVGPAAGPCCYEVGREVADCLDPHAVTVRDGRIFADLRCELALRLTAAGVQQDRMDSSTECTVCTPSRYFSHRRDDIRAGRMLGYILLNDTRKGDT